MQGAIRCPQGLAQAERKRKRAEAEAAVSEAIKAAEQRTAERNAAQAASQAAGAGAGTEVGQGLLAPASGSRGGAGQEESRARGPQGGSAEPPLSSEKIQVSDRPRDPSDRGTGGIVRGSIVLFKMICFVRHCHYMNLLRDIVRVRRGRTEGFDGPRSEGGNRVTKRNGECVSREGTRDSRPPPAMVF